MEERKPFVIGNQFMLSHSHSESRSDAIELTIENDRGEQLVIRCFSPVAVGLARAITFAATHSDEKPGSYRDVQPAPPSMN